MSRYKKYRAEGRCGKCGSPPVTLETKTLCGRCAADKRRLMKGKDYGMNVCLTYADCDRIYNALVPLYPELAKRFQRKV